MQVFGLGIDVVEVARVAAAIDKHGDTYLDKIFTSNEREYCDSRHDPVIHYAARFAAKEAVAKALGTGISKHAALHDLEVGHHESGQPCIFLSGAANDFAKSHGISQIHLSLTHTNDYAAANAVALSDG